MKLEWIARNGYLSQAEQENNAVLIYYKLAEFGFSFNAVCGILGNMVTESTVNPGIWEALSPFDPKYGGYGLVQWTPYTKYADWAGEGWENNGDKQCERINYESENGLQWFGNPQAPSYNPPVTFKEFKSSDLDAQTLAEYWFWYYEHPGNNDPSQRRKSALYWETYLSKVPPPPPIHKVRRRHRMHNEWAYYILKTKGMR